MGNILMIIVGLFMMGSVINVDFEDFTEGLPAFLTIIMMPLTYSIGDGLMFGVISYALLKLISGRAKEASPVIYILAILFTLSLDKYLSLIQTSNNIKLLSCL